MDGNLRPSLKSLDDRLRECRELMQRGNDWLAADGTALSERYRNGQQNLAIRCVNSGRGDYGVVLKAGPCGDVLKSFTQHLGSDRDPERRNVRLEQTPMFPRVVEIVERNQHVIVPSMPRLQRFDNGPIGLGKPLYLFTSCVFPLEESGSTLADGELRIFGVNVAVASGEQIHQHIETASETVEDRASLDVDNSRDALDGVKANDLLAKLRIRLVGNTIWGTLPPRFNAICEHVELGYGPVNSSISI